jgi:hypothetical protein
MVKLIAVSFALFVSAATTVAGAQPPPSTARAVAAMEGDLAKVGVPEALSTSPAQCYLQLEQCLDHCDGDINCNRLCARQYQKCMGH